MLRIYFITAIRNFRRTIFVSIINLLGLSLGLATCIVAGLCVKQHLEADTFHQDLDAIHRVTVKMPSYEMPGTPYSFADALREEHAEVFETLKTTEEETVLKIGDELHKHSVLFADPNFLSFFTFPLASGNREKALSGLKQIVLSHEMAARYYPNADPLGQIIKLELNNVYTDFEITGVAQPTPAYSTLYFDFVVPIENAFLATPAIKSDWTRFFVSTFVKVKPEQLTKVQEAMPAFVVNHMPGMRKEGDEPGTNFVFSLYQDHHLSEGYAYAGLRQGMSRQSLVIFSGIALVILLLACFNFMNLTNAQSSRRSVEVGVKKVIGAYRTQLIRQFLAEALLLTFVAAFLALGLAELSLFVFRDLLQSSISVFDSGNWDVYAGLVLITLITGVLGGIYPAFILSGLSVLATLKKYFRIGGSNWVTRSILGVQFTVSIMLIISAIIMWKQQGYLMEKDLGYNHEQVLVLKISQKDTATADYLKNELHKFPEVVNVSRTSTAFTDGMSASHHVTADGTSMFINIMSVDADFMSTMDIKLAQGEGYNEQHKPFGSEIIVNETLVRELGLQDSIGMKLGGTLGWINQPTIIGVAKDFHHSMLRHEIGPLMIIHSFPLSDTYLLIRLAPGNMLQGLNRIRKLFEQTNPDSLFEYSFLDDQVNRQYEAEKRWSTIISLATGMAIFLSVLGLLGLAMFTAEQRKKEIGIRKVLGASFLQLIGLLSKGYAALIVISFIIAGPVAYYVMNTYWLNEFAYHTNFDAFIFILALMVVLAIVGLSIGSQTIRAARQNPAETLKEE